MFYLPVLLSTSSFSLAAEDEEEEEKWNLL